MVPLVVTGKCSHALIHLRANAACAKINMSFYKYQNEKDMQLKILKEEARQGKRKQRTTRMLNINPVQRLYSILTKILMERLTRQNMVSVFVTGSF